VKNMSFMVITYDPSFHPFLMLTIDQFLTIVRLPSGRPTQKAELRLSLATFILLPWHSRMRRCWL
jgi:hypothetical protein